MLKIAISLSMVLLGSAATMAVAQSPQPLVLSRTPEPRTPASAQEARALANEFAAILEKDYYSPAIGARYAQLLRRNAAAGVYDRIGDPVDLGDKMTEDLQAVNKDAHLAVFLRGYGPAMKAEAKAKAAGTPPPRPEALSGAKWIADGVAYISINFMPQHEAALSQMRRFMEEHAGARALIIDVRECTGGGIQLTNEIFPYLYGRPTTLVRMDERASGGPSAMTFGNSKTVFERKGPKGIKRTDQVAVPHPTEKRLFDAKVYVLTSPKTVSAGEHLAFALQQSGRATVIGEKTTGAGNFGSFRPFAKRFMAFIPVGRTYDPKTGKSWEGVGVIPNVKVSAGKALDEAIRLAGGGSTASR